MADYLVSMISSSRFLTLLFIYIGTLCYVTASYFHISLNDWTFLKAFLIALPIVCIEYQFSLRANRIAVSHHGFNAIQVLLITLCFYFVNIWILNWLVLKHKVNIWRELLCFALIIMAFLISTNW